MEGKELFLMVEAISNEKSISKEDVFISLEEALSMATKKRSAIDVEVKLDRKTGDMSTFRRWLIVEDEATLIGEEQIPFDESIHLYAKDAQDITIEGFKYEQIENAEFGRIAAQIAKQVIIKKVREAERSVIVDNYSKRVGEVISTTVKRVDRGNVYVDMGGVDAMIARNDLIPNESVRKNDRLRAYIKNVKSTDRGAQIFLSRTANDMMAKLFEMEVPEIADGVIEIMSCARDPGLRSKLAVKAKDRRIDPIGSCIGMRGVRVQAVSNELNGERVDVILWDQDPAQFVINAMAPAEVKSIVVDEDKLVMDIAVEEQQLALAIGRGGQNIKLASKLTGWKLNVMSTNEAEDKQTIIAQKNSKKLAEQLGVDSEVAGVLIEEGFNNIDEIADTDTDKLEQIAEFNVKMAEEIQERAQDAQLVQALGDADSLELLMSVKGVDEILAQALIEADITTIDNLAELSTDELLDIQNIDNKEASSIIMAAREIEGWFN